MVFFQSLGGPVSKFIPSYALPYLRHQPLVETEIMQRYKDRTEHFAHIKEMSQSTPAKIHTATTVTADLYRPGVVYVGIVSEADWPAFSKGKGISSVSCRQHAIEHVDTGFYRCNNITRRAYAHQVARLMPRQKPCCMRNRLYHIIVPLTHT